VERSELKLECVKLAMSKIIGKDPSEIIELAKRLEEYILPTTPCSQPEKVATSGTSEQKPNDTAKEQKNLNSKK
jgi:hypothetical protein